MTLFRYAVLLMTLCWMGINQAEPTATASQKMVVFVDASSGLQTLSRSEVKGLFLGRNRFAGGASRVITYDFPPDSAVRIDFYQTLTGKDIAVIDAYLARLKYSGNVSLPLVERDYQALLSAVKNNYKALAYAPLDWYEQSDHKGLRVVHILDLTQ